MATNVTFKTRKCGDVRIKVDGRQCGLIVFPSGEAMEDSWKIRLFVTTPTGYNNFILNADFNSAKHCKKFIKARIDEILERYSIYFMPKKDE